MTGGQGLIIGVRGVAGVWGGTALVTQLVTVTRPLDRSKENNNGDDNCKTIRVNYVNFYRCMSNCWKFSRCPRNILLALERRVGSLKNF